MAAAYAIQSSQVAAVRLSLPVSATASATIQMTPHRRGCARKASSNLNARSTNQDYIPFSRGLAADTGGAYAGAAPIDRDDRAKREALGCAHAGPHLCAKLHAFRPCRGSVDSNAKRVPRLEFTPAKSAGGAYVPYSGMYARVPGRKVKVVLAVVMFLPGHGAILHQ